MSLPAELQTFYNAHKRSHLPWRATSDPYKILVSELMLQQTQVDRVVPKYREFLRAFPTVKALAKAPLSQVLFHWQGLGYNRRAKYLHETAKAIVAKHQGTFPKTTAELLLLPGIGPYTARAVAAFAFNEPEVFIETNIRTVFTHHYFNAKDYDVMRYHNHTYQRGRQRLAVPKQMGPHTKIADAELLPLIKRDLKRSRMEPREFYAALMDYGSHLKKNGLRLNGRSKHYVKQSKFEGSARQLRGALLRELLAAPATAAQLHQKSGRTLTEVTTELSRLQKEGLVMRRGTTYRLPEA